MAFDYKSIGNDVINLAAVVDSDSTIARYEPLRIDNTTGQLYTLTLYPLLLEPGDYFQPYIIDTRADYNVEEEAYGLLTGSVGYMNNPSTGLERLLNNHDVLMLSSDPRSSTTASGAKTNHNHRGAHFIIDVSDIETDATLTPTIQGRDSISSNYYDILTGLEITTVGTHVLKVYPGIGQIPNGAASDILPRTFRINMVYGGTDDITYSVSYALIM